MLPYIDIPPLRPTDWLAVQPFGLLVMAGCVAGWFVARREARLRGLDPEVMDGVALWALLIGFPMASVFDVVFYYPELLVSDPLAALQFWRYMSSFGGFLGGTLGATGYLLLRRVRMLPYLDSLVVGLAVGWFFGRLGCAIVHDHPGSHTDFILGVRFPDGVRHDLGLYEWLYTIVMLAILYSLPRHRFAPGATLALVCMMYAPVRFGLDFLRAADRLYWGLTPGQYASMAVFAVSLAVLAASRRGGAADAHAG